MKYPSICETPGARSGGRPGALPATACAEARPAPAGAFDLGRTPDPEARPTYAYAYGRLRPRFVDAGAWQELWCLLHDDPTRHADDDLDRVLAKAFEPRADGSMPDGMHVARELVWPLEDALGVPQCIVVPQSDRQILELVEALCAGPARCRPSAHVIVRGTLVGHAGELPGKLRGLPRVTLLSAFPHDFETSIGPGLDEDRERLFRSYRPLLANNGLGDELRAINYVLTQSTPLYELASRLCERTCEHHHEQRLVGMHAQPVEGTVHAPQMEVVCTFQGNEGGLRSWFQRVDVQGPFMFFTTEELQPFYLRPRGAIRPQEAAWSWAAPSPPPIERAPASPPPAPAPASPAVVEAAAQEPVVASSTARE